MKQTRFYFSLSGGGGVKLTDTREAFLSTKTGKLLIAIPLDRLLFETDAPDQLPYELKEKKRENVHNNASSLSSSSSVSSLTLSMNDPSLVKWICFHYARYLDIDVNELARITYENSRRALLMDS
jgi:TatD DNase family protein